MDKLKVVKVSGSQPAPKKYRRHWVENVQLLAEPVGYDPLTNTPIYWGDGHEIACLLIEDDPDIPF